MSLLATLLLILTFITTILGESVTINTTCNYVYDDSGIDTPRSPGYCNLRIVNVGDGDTYYIQPVDSNEVYEGWQYVCQIDGSITVLHKTSTQVFTTCDDGTEYNLTTWASSIGSPVGYQCDMTDCTVTLRGYKTNACNTNLIDANLIEINPFVVSYDACYEADTGEYSILACNNNNPSKIDYTTSDCSGSPSSVSTIPQGYCFSDNSDYITYMWEVNTVSQGGNCLDPTTAMPSMSPVTNTPTNTPSNMPTNMPSSGPTDMPIDVIPETSDMPDMSTTETETESSGDIPTEFPSFAYQINSFISIIFVIICSFCL